MDLHRFSAFDYMKLVVGSALVAAAFQFFTFPNSIVSGGITGRVGVNFGPNFAVEGEGSFGVKGDSGTELDSEIGVFAVGKLPVNPSLDVFGRVGVSRIETSPFGDEDGLAYGAGAQWNLTAQDGIRGDWTRHDYDAGDVDAYSLSYVRSF